MRVDIHRGDALAVLRRLPSASVHCIVTSPPYWGLRDYDEEGQIGVELTPTAYVDALCAVLMEARRVLRPEGIMWLNLGDSYIRSGGSETARETPAEPGWHGGIRNLTKGAMNPAAWAELGLKPKDLAGIPWMVAFALRAAGWYLRRDIVWHKPNCMPESVTDRPSTVHETLFMLTKSADYFFDAEAIAEPVAGSSEVGCCPSCRAPWERVVEKWEPDLEARRAAGPAPLADGRAPPDTRRQRAAATVGGASLAQSALWHAQGLRAVDAAHG